MHIVHNSRRSIDLFVTTGDYLGMKPDTTHAIVAPNFAENLRELLRNYMFQRRLSQEEIATRLKISQSMVSKFLLGEANFSVDNIDAMIRMIQADPAQTDAPMPRILREKAAKYPDPDRVCASCGERVFGPQSKFGYIYCGKCGSPLGIECDHCGTITTQEGAHFCVACGKPLTKDAHTARDILQNTIAPQQKAHQDAIRTTKRRKPRRTSNPFE